MPSPNMQMLTFLAANIAVYAPAVMSQSLSGLPDLKGLPDLTGLDKCAVTCSMSAYTSTMQACPTMTDVACFCKNADFIRISRACMVATCPPSFLPNAGSFAIKTCASVGVTLPAAVTANPALSTPGSTVTASTSVPVVQANSTTSADIADPPAAAFPAPVATTYVTPDPVLASVVDTVSSNPNVLNTTASAANVVNTAPAATNVVNTSTVTQPAVVKANTSINKPAASSPASQLSAPQNSTSSTETSGCSTTRATGFFVIGSLLASLFVL